LDDPGADDGKAPADDEPEKVARLAHHFSLPDQVNSLLNRLGLAASKPVVAGTMYPITSSIDNPCGNSGVQNCQF
jgi:hypothetical protein